MDEPKPGKYKEPTTIFLEVARRLAAGAAVETPLDGDYPAHQYALNDITKADFQRWKHNPVSKLFFQYLRDYATQLREHQLAKIEMTDEPMKPKEEGEYKGRINAVTELAAIQFEHLLELYPVADEETDEGKA